MRIINGCLSERDEINNMLKSLENGRYYVVIQDADYRDYSIMDEKKTGFWSKIGLNQMYSIGTIHISGMLGRGAWGKIYDGPPETLKTIAKHLESYGLKMTVYLP